MRALAEAHTELRDLSETARLAVSTATAVANDLVAMSEEPNVRIMESKALLCRVERLT